MPYLNLLLLEDTPNDEKLVLREFKKAGYQLSYQRVQNARDYLESLKTGKWDIIISDYQMPSFDGIEALRLLKANAMDIPFIIVSGHIGESTAVLTMREGADDYVMKDNMKRLVPAAERAIKAAENRREKRKTEQELEEMRLRMEGIITSAMDAIITANHQHKVVMMNKAAEDMFGYKAHEIIGRHITFLMPERFHERYMQFVHSFDSTPEVSSISGTNRTVYGLRADGKEFPTETSISKVTIREKNYFTAILRDISLRIEAERQEKQLNAELLRQNEQLQQFGFIASHKMRGPIASLLGLLNLYRKRDQETFMSMDQFVSYINSSVEKLDRVVQDMSTILEYKTQINTIKEDIALEDVLKNVESELQSFIKRTNARIKVEWKISKVYSVKSYIQNIFYHLISNAIKYQHLNTTPLIYITSSIANKDNKEWICITFTDNGIGIDLNRFRDKIFGLYNRFHQHVEGKGLGLHLVKTQVEALNGQIEVESQEGKGTAFHIYLPAS